jgi:hypothetical protein
MLVRVITYTFTDPRIPGAGEQVYRLVTTLLDPFLYPARELAVLYHQRWHVEPVIDEARTHLRLSARTLRSLSPEGVLQEIYALLLAHLVVRTLMLQAAEQAQISPTQISFTETIRIMDEHLIPLSLVTPARRLHMVESAIKEIGEQRLPKQRVRIQPRVVKRVRSRYERKKAEHWHGPSLELDVDFHEIIELVPTHQPLWARACLGEIQTKAWEAPSPENPRPVSSSLPAPVAQGPNKDASSHLLPCPAGQAAGMAQALELAAFPGVT